MSCSAHRLTTRALTLSIASVLIAAGCAPPPRPAAMARADEVRVAPAVTDAVAFAPQMVAHAESLRRQADDAYDRGDIATATILAERAVVAFERAAVLARIARAETRAAEAETKQQQAARKQRVLDAEKNRLEADIASLQQLIQVVRDAQPITPTPRADHAREMARLKAARSILVDARLLCSAAKLLDKPLQGFEQVETEVARLEELLAQWPKPAPIDDTLRVRAQCLSFLTLARRSGNAAAPADLVLTELSKQRDVQPLRDDRGIVVTVRGNIKPDSTAQSRLDAIADAAAKHTQFPVLVVSHTRAKPSRTTTNTAKERAETVLEALRAAGIDENRIQHVHAGPHRPVVHDPLPPPHNSKNDRIEIVLVAPSS